MKKKTPEFLLDVKNPFEGEKLLKEYANGKIIIGVDEVGRGPLAGPVVACAVVLTLPLAVIKLLSTLPFITFVKFTLSRQ